MNDKNEGFAEAVAEAEGPLLSVGTGVGMELDESEVCTGDEGVVGVLWEGFWRLRTSSLMNSRADDGALEGDWECSGTLILLD